MYVASSSNSEPRYTEPMQSMFGLIRNAIFAAIAYILTVPFDIYIILIGIDSRGYKQVPVRLTR